MVRVRFALVVCLLPGCTDFVAAPGDDAAPEADGATSGKADDPSVGEGDGSDDGGDETLGDGEDGSSSGDGGDEPGDVPDPPVPDTCGDGVVDAGEDCDDAGPSIDCDADCTAAVCGDGLRNAEAGEACDDGGPSATCDDDCTLASCGDGNVNEAAGELCDGPGCSADCRSCDPTVPTPLLVEDFSQGDGWSTEGSWSIGASQFSGETLSCGFGDPAQDHSPGGNNGIAGAVIGGNVGTSMHPYRYLTSPTVDAVPGEPLTLSYWRWLNSDATPYMANHVQVYDGAQWVTVWSSTSWISEQAWSEHTHDISAYANDALRVRFGFSVGAEGAYACAGWNVDDVRIETLTCG